MRVFWVGSLVCGLALGVWAQPYRTYGSPSGFGNILFPGTGHPPPLRSTFSITDPTFAGRLAATISGFPPYTGAPAQMRGHGRGAALAPLMYPVFVGGYYGPAYEPQPSVIVYPPAQPAPQVVINQYFGPSSEAPSSAETGVRITQVPPRAPAPPPAQETVTFLIATTDGSVFTAAAYWVEGETLHYVTPYGKHEQVALNRVDRQLSEKLNEGRQVEFRLPAAK